MSESKEKYTSPPEMVSKLEGAERLLKTVILLFFDGGDDLAIHALSAGSHEVLNTLLKKSGRGNGFIRDHSRIRPESLAEYTRHMNRTQNFLKHANRDPEARLDYYKDATPFWIFDAVTMHELLTGSRQFPEFFLFIAWFMLEHPSILYEGAVLDLIKQTNVDAPFTKEHFNDRLKNPSAYPPLVQPKKNL